MHVRVLLSRYRSYTPCETCDGARLKTEALLWRLGNRELADTVLGKTPRFKPKGVQWSDETANSLPGLTVHDVMLLPVDRAVKFFSELKLPQPGRLLLDGAWIKPEGVSQLPRRRQVRLGDVPNA